MKRIISFVASALFLSFFIVSAQGMNNIQDTAITKDLQVAVFDVDITPPKDYKMPYGVALNTWDMGLRAKGIVLFGTEKPIVLVSLDWLGIANDCYDEFKRSLAQAAGTIPEHVAVHVIHQHDAPYPRDCLNDSFVLSVIHRLEMAVINSLENAISITHIGFGEAPVHKVASNRRILGEDGKIKAMRWTVCKDSSLRTEPEGLIDPVLSAVSFWNENKPVAVLNFYATHPQSYYGTGVPNPDYPGIARFYRQLAIPDALQVYFTGAGGNVGAGKYNDGSHENRGVLAERLADGMKRAWENTKQVSVISSDIQWTFDSVVLPLDSAKAGEVLWKRYKADKKVDIQCLTIGNEARILFMPGELLVEYQIAAKKMRPGQFVAMAAYGDLSFGYIPPAAAFPQGGYEVDVAKVTPEAETVLLNAISKLLNDKTK
ncbi:hypothetical protein [Proteiniphilum sp. UBA7639]|jgi:hypothetical protein|uniref:hypothetical protein n=1 Tax=Proteiniphilum sp. UBA7639 TaxID=1947289 RepID=UPI00257E5766|nr:hypothetical protein [Proteiniphilum sp. UBA7639]